MTGSASTTSATPSSLGHESKLDEIRLGNRAASKTELLEKNEELRKLIGERIQDRMYTLGLRSGERNELINRLYGAYLQAKPGELLFSSIEEVNKALEDGKKLAHLADLTSGDRSFSTDLSGLSVNQLQAYLETTYKKGKSEQYDQSLDPASLLLEALKAAKLDKLPSDKSFKEIWTSGLPEPTPELSGPGGFSAGHFIPKSTRTVSAQELMAKGPSALMQELAYAGAARVRNHPFQRYDANGNKKTGQCAGYVRKSFGDADVTNGEPLGDAKDLINVLQRRPNFALVTGVTMDMLNKLPEGCVIVHKKASDPGWYGHVCITLDPAKNRGSTAVSHIFQRNRLVYKPQDLHVFVPVSKI